MKTSPLAGRHVQLEPFDATLREPVRRERVTWTGHVRDSVLFAVTDLDWPDVRARLERRLGIHSLENA